MGYGVNNKRNKDGSGYTLSYGRGNKKLTAQMQQTADGWVWLKPGGAGPSQAYLKMTACKAAWGEWAERHYEGTPSPSAPAPAPVVAGPPVYVPKPATVPGPPTYAPPSYTPPVKPTLPPAPPDLEKQCAGDPFDAQFRYRDGTLTPLGCLVEILGWYQRYEPRVKRISADLAAESSPAYDPFYYLIEGIKTCLGRECPDLSLEPTDVRTFAKRRPAQPPQPAHAIGRAAPVGPSLDDLDTDVPF